MTLNQNIFRWLDLSLRKKQIYPQTGGQLKLSEGSPNVVDGIKNDEINLVINTPLGPQSRYDEEAIGRACIQKSIMAITTLSGAEAAVRAIRLTNQTIQVRSIQEYHH